jgi:single-strand DNA-binding protein
MQKLQIIGNIGKDAELLTTKGGKEYIKFSVATTKKVGEQTQTTWHDCVKWIYDGKGKGILDYLLKGVKVYVEGEVTANAYVNNQGDVVGTLNLNVQFIELLVGGEKKTERPVVESSVDASEHPDDLPF